MAPRVTTHWGRGGAEAPGSRVGKGEEFMHRHLGLTLVLDFTTAALGRPVPDDFKTVESLGRLAQ